MPEKYILLNQKSYPFSDMCAFFCYISYFLFSLYRFCLFEVEAKLVFFTISAVSALVANFACANLAAKVSVVNLLGS